MAPPATGTNLQLRIALSRVGATPRWRVSVGAAVGRLGFSRSAHLRPPAQSGSPSDGAAWIRTRNQATSGSRVFARDDAGLRHGRCEEPENVVRYSWFARGEERRRVKAPKVKMDPRSTARGDDNLLCLAWCIALSPGLLVVLARSSKHGHVSHAPNHFRGDGHIAPTSPVQSVKSV